MRDHHQFHDGWFEGLWIDGKRVHVYLSTIDKTRFTFVAEDVVALSADDIKTGNIILDVSTRTHEELHEDDVAALPELQMKTLAEPTQRWREFTSKSS
jgi:hypothetical protein